MKNSSLRKNCHYNICVVLCVVDTIYGQLFFSAIFCWFSYFYFTSGYWNLFQLFSFNFIDFVKISEKSLIFLLLWDVQIVYFLPQSSNETFLQGALACFLSKDSKWASDVLLAILLLFLGPQWWKKQTQDWKSI